MDSGVALEAIDASGLRPIEASQVLSYVESGGVVIVRRGLQTIGWLQPLIDLSMAELRAVVGDAKAEKVAAHGFESLHRHLSVEEVLTFNERAMGKLAPVAPRMLKRVAHDILGISGGFLEQLPNARTFIPYDHVMKHQAAFKAAEARRGPGKVTEHGPHHDSWFEHPLNTINVWSAISSVADGNGMLIFPEMWGRRLPYDSTGAIRKDQVYGRPFNFDLAAGDIVLFSGEHLHGSELNRTTDTRFVISMRLTAKAPRFHGRKHNYPYLDARLVGTRLERLAKWPVKAQPDYIIGKLKDLRNRGKPASWKGSPESRNIPPLDDTSADFPADIAIETGEAGTLSFPVGDLAPGDVLPVNASWCAGRKPDGEVIAFSRRCPHQGADLAAGHIRADGQIMCPWHNLTFDPASGASPCSKLKLRVAPVSVEDGRGSIATGARNRAPVDA